MKPALATLVALAALSFVGCKSRGHADGGGEDGCYDVPQNHRPAEELCDGGNTIPRGPDSGANQCERDSDCAGYDPDAGMVPGKGLCSCAPNTRGFAGVSYNSCVDSNCHVDADCAGGYCSPTVLLGCGAFYGVQGYYCHTPQDTCLNDCDCGDGGYCAYGPAIGYWTCGYGRCAG